ncbi:AAA family ATPase Grc3 [Pseudohyphozyma bogoriensis]|nr:AAA family ATPase Grc3 [Pseudohyphozyma bogoriensis]
MSAVAARKAALAAASAPPSPIITPTLSDASASEDDEADMSGVEDAEAEAELASAVVGKGKRKAAVKGKGKAGRYFAGGNEGGERVGVPNEGGGQDEQNELFELTRPRSGKMGRGKRQRRERSAFVDPECYSRFTPVSGENVFRVEWQDSEGTQSGLIVVLQATDFLIIHGSLLLTPLIGSLSVLSSTLTSSPPTPTFTLPPPPSTQHRLFAPSSHPLPPIHPLHTVVLLSDMGSGVEGVETVLSHAGMGCGYAMWDVNAKGAVWGGAGWKIILEPTPSLTSLRMPDTWSSTLESFVAPSARKAKEEEETEDSEDEFEGQQGSERMVVMVEGPKHVGKSTFAKLVLNKLLSRYERVAYLDTDLGQPEFTTPGSVSLSVVDSPVLGPSFTHLSLPVASHFLGSTSPASDPSSYLSAISALLSTYALEVEYPLIDEPAPSRFRRVPSQPSSKIRDRVPLVINTQGWVKGLGADLLLKLKEEARPNILFSFDLEDGDDGMGRPAEPGCFHLAAAPPSPLDSKWSAADLRTLGLISYFHSTFDVSSPSSPTPTKNVFPSGWDYSTPLVGKTPFAVEWSGGRSISSVHIIESDIAYEQVLHVLNGSVVALVRDFAFNPDETPTHPVALPYWPYATTPSPSTSRTLGLGVIHSIDPSTRTLNILTPVSASELGDPVALVKGAIELPLSLMLDFTANEEEAEKGIAGVEWKDVPYLGVEGDVGGRRKVRRNLMRRAQA